MRLDWRQLEVTLGSCGRVRCEPGWRLDEGWSRRLMDYDLWFVWAGRGRMRLRDGRELTLRPGVGLWARPGGLYLAEQDLDDRLGVSFVHFDLRDRRTNDRPEALPPEVHDVAELGYVDAVLRRVVDLAGGQPVPGLAQHAQGPEVARQLMRGLLMDLDAAADARDRAAPAPAHAPIAGRPAGGTPRHHRQMIARLVTRIRESPGDVPPVTDLAREAGYSPDHFARVFRQVMGLSPQAFIVQARLERARQLLTESSLTVTQIADVLGYESVYFFSRQFKQKLGSSPSAYRQRPGAAPGRAS